MNLTKVIVGLSGGVDSSVAALLLLEQGYQVEGLFMKNWEEDDDSEYCAAADDLADAQSVADRLGIKLHRVNFATEYWDQVFNHFLNEYRAGRTPNPDVLCNREIKFKAFLDYALDLGADKIATGHYAAINKENGTWLLEQADDKDKDQTYFLYLLNQYQLSHSLFPLSGLNKTQVRNIAQKAGLETHDKKDSTGICFIGERRFRAFLSKYLSPQPGDIETLDGDIIGQHQGLMYHTIGQRQGLGIGGLHNYSDTPWYVCKKDLERNTLIVVQGNNHPLLYKEKLVAIDEHWISGERPGRPFNTMARFRHGQALQGCRIEMADDHLHIKFSQPQRAITPGQAIVFYENQTCLGGATIEST